MRKVQTSMWAKQIHAHIYGTCERVTHAQTQEGRYPLGWAAINKGKLWIKQKHSFYGIFHKGLTAPVMKNK